MWNSGPQGEGVRIRNSEFGIPEAPGEVWIQNSEFRIRNPEFGILGPPGRCGFRIQNSEFGILGLQGRCGFGIQTSEFGIPNSRAPGEVRIRNSEFRIRNSKFWGPGADSTFGMLNSNCEFWALKVRLQRRASHGQTYSYNGPRVPV